MNVRNDKGISHAINGSKATGAVRAGEGELVSGEQYRTVVLLNVLGCP